MADSLLRLPVAARLLIGAGSFKDCQGGSKVEWEGVDQPVSEIPRHIGHQVHFYDLSTALPQPSSPSVACHVPVSNSRQTGDSTCVWTSHVNHLQLASQWFVHRLLSRLQIYYTSNSAVNDLGLRRPRTHRSPYGPTTALPELADTSPCFRCRVRMTSSVAMVV
jgi:hypothetical protein